MDKERARESENEKERVDIQRGFKRNEKNVVILQFILTLPLYIYLYSQKIGQLVGAYPPSISLPLFLENREGIFGLPSLYISTLIHRKQDMQFGLTLSLYINIFSQKIGQVVGSYHISISLPLFIEKRTGSLVVPSLYISTSIHRKKDRQVLPSLYIYIYLYSYSQKIGQIVWSYPHSICLPLLIENRTGSLVLPSLYMSTSIHRKKDRQVLPSLYIYIYLYSYSQKIGQIVWSYPHSIYLPVYIGNRTGSFVSPFLYMSTSIDRKQDRQFGLTLSLHIYLTLFIENRTGSLVLPSL